jgi:hypothetical protein
MNLGATIAVFLIVAVCLLLLFCALLKWFDYRLKENMNIVARRYTDEDNASWCTVAEHHC